LAVRVGRQVDGDAVDRAGEIGAVIELEATQVILVRLPLAAVLADDETGDVFENLARPQDRLVDDLRLVDRPFGACRRSPDEVRRPSGRAHAADLRNRCRRGAR
jgi:hypothetical protein